MFNIGPPELIVILLVALLIVGPKRLPEVGKSVGKALREIRRQTDEVRSSFEMNLDDDPDDTHDEPIEDVTASAPIAAAGGDDQGWDATQWNSNDEPDVAAEAGTQSESGAETSPSSATAPEPDVADDATQANVTPVTTDATEPDATDSADDPKPEPAVAAAAAEGGRRRRRGRSDPAGSGGGAPDAS